MLDYMRMQYAPRREARRVGIAESLYSVSPIWIQNTMVSLKGLGLKMQRYGPEYRRFKRSLPSVYKLCRAEALDHQMRLFRGIVSYAMNHSRFYAELYKGFNVEDIKCIEDLGLLPTVDKETIRKNIDSVYTIPVFRALEGHTGGTTGKSLVVRFTWTDMQRRMADLDYFRERHGFRHGMRRAVFSGKHLVYPSDENKRCFWRDNWALGQRFYSTFHLSENNMQLYIDDLNEYCPNVLEGFTSCIVDLCRYVERKGQKIAFRPVAVFPTSEPLFPEQREVIRRVLGVEPRDQYASSEGAPFIFECEEGSLHYALHTGIIEVGSDGQGIVTSFTSYGTPLIRYLIGDKFEVCSSRCSCGWDTPVFARIEGRVIDYLFSRERGRIYSPNLSNVVKSFPNSVVQTQFIQRSIDCVTVKVVVDQRRFDEDRDADTIRREVAIRMGAGVRIDVQVVDQIARESSGKTRFVVNDLQNQCASVSSSR